MIISQKLEFSRCNFINPYTIMDFVEYFYQPMEIFSAYVSKKYLLLFNLMENMMPSFLSQKVISYEIVYTFSLIVILLLLPLL